MSYVDTVRSSNCKLNEDNGTDVIITGEISLENIAALEVFWSVLGRLHI